MGTSSLGFLPEFMLISPTGALHPLEWYPARCGPTVLLVCASGHASPTPCCWCSWPTCQGLRWSHNEARWSHATGTVLSFGSPCRFSWCPVSSLPQWPKACYRVPSPSLNVSCSRRTGPTLNEPRSIRTPRHAATCNAY